jgi:hypothetical protein
MIGGGQNIIDLSQKSFATSGIIVPTSQRRKHHRDTGSSERACCLIIARITR